MHVGIIKIIEQSLHSVRILMLNLRQLVMMNLCKPPDSVAFTKNATQNWKDFEELGRNRKCV